MEFKNMLVIMSIYECKDNILQALSKKEAIVLCTIFHCNLSIKEKKRYYRSTYIENGISTSAFSVHDGTKVPSEILYSMKDLENFLKYWAKECKTASRLIHMYTKNKDHRISIRIKTTGASIVSEDLIKMNNEGSLYQQTMNRACSEHFIAQKPCFYNFVSMSQSAIKVFDNYIGTEVVPIINRLYSCRPYTIHHYVK